jgi:dTDP-4-dehydrorhamnose 3,5-epimerase
VRWDDPAINIRWPVAEPTVSPRDALAPPLAEVEHGFRWQE